MTKILIEMHNSNPQLGAVASTLEIAEQLTEKGHVIYFCGNLTQEFLAICDNKKYSTLSIQSISFAKSKLVQYCFSFILCVLKIRKMKPDIIIQNYTGWGQSISFTAKILSIPVMSRGGADFNPKNPSNKWISGYLAYNKFHARKLLQSPLADKVFITGHPFTPRHLSFDSSKKNDSGVPKFVFLGQLQERKGITFLVEAFAKMKEDAVLQIIGGDWNAEGYPQEIKSLIEKEEIEDKVELINHQSNVSFWLSQSDAFVFPSLNDTHPRVIMEAMVLGLPIVSINSGGIPEMIEDGRTGMLTEPGDIEAFVLALDKLAASRELRDRLGNNAQKECSERLKKNKAVDEYEKFFNFLIGKHID